MRPAGLEPVGYNYSGGSAQAVAAAFQPRVSQYIKALVQAPPPRQFNAVKGLSQNINDLQYCMGMGASAANTITDADVYDCEPGWITFGRNYNAGTPTSTFVKGLAFAWEKMTWDLSLGQSLLIQARIKTISASSNQTLFGNSSGTTEGIGLVLNTGGTFSLNFKGTGSSAQAITIAKPGFDGTTTATQAIATDTPVNLTIYIDGATRVVNAWIDGVASSLNESAQGNTYGNAFTALNPGSTQADPPHNFGFGYIPSDASFTPAVVRAGAFQSFMWGVFPAGVRVRDPDWIDRAFNRDPFRIPQDSDLIYT